MIHELYNINNNFNDLIVHNDYTNLFVTKPIHNDRIAKFKHFTAYFYSNITKVNSNKYHFYVNINNKIVSITQIQNII